MNVNFKDLSSQYDLVLLDIDDVVITPKQYICSSEWYRNYHMKNKNILSKDQLINDFYKCLSATEYKPVLVELIDSFSAGLNVFGFTARTKDFASETEKQVASVGMQFSIIANSSDIKNGIIYAGYNASTALPNNKGKILNNLLAEGVFGKVTSILFIDDSHRNLNEVREELPPEIQFTAIYFTKVKDSLINQYNELKLQLLGSYQLDYFLINETLPSNEWVCDNMGVCPVLPISI